MLLSKYAPLTSRDIIGNGVAIREIGRWLASWRPGQTLLVHGPAGTGKTTAIRLVAKELGYEVLEVYADEKIPAADIKSASAQRSLFSKKKLILLENTLTMRGFSDIVKSSASPVICTTEDAYKLNPSVRKLFKLVKFDKVREDEMVAFAKKILYAEGVSMDEKKIAQLARMCNGDVRAMLIDMEAVRLGADIRHTGYRNFEENIFNTVRLIFKTMSIENARIAMENCEKDTNELFFWLEQNILEEYTDPESIARAYDYLSKADVFASRIIRRQSWGLQKYASDMTVYGTALSKPRPSARFVSYRPPFMRRQASRSALVKIAVGLHTSVSNAAAYVPIIRMHPKVCEELGLDEKETDSLALG